MRAALLVLLCACGIDLNPRPAPRVVAGTVDSPQLEVAGETADAGFYPTEVILDDRDAGWVVSCLDGRAPAVAWEHPPLGRSIARVFCNAGAP